MRRWMAWVVASLGGYFWLPCDHCSRHFGGHERGWKPRDVRIAGDRLLCPRCADREICTCASAYGEFIGCKLHGIEADNTNRENGSDL